MASSEPPDRQPPRRFIAGAVCPNCKIVDKLYVLVRGDKTSRHCTRCDFEDELTDEPGDETNENIQTIRLPE